MSTAPKIPILDLQPQIEALWDEFNTAFQRVLRSAHFILGPEEQAFEKEAAAYWAPGTPSGSTPARMPCLWRCGPWASARATR